MIIPWICVDEIAINILKFIEVDEITNFWMNVYKFEVNGVLRVGWR